MEEARQKKLHEVLLVQEAQRQQRLKEEAGRLQREAEALKAEQLEKMMKDCQNWNDVYAKFDVNAPPQPLPAPHPLSSTAPHPGLRPLNEDQQLVMQVAKDIGYGNIGDDELQRVRFFWVFSTSFLPRFWYNYFVGFRIGKVEFRTSFPNFGTEKYNKIQRTIKRNVPYFNS